MHLEVFTQLFVTGAGDKCHQLENLGGLIVLQFSSVIFKYRDGVQIVVELFFQIFNANIYESVSSGIE